MIQVFDEKNKATELEKSKIVSFLFENLEQYGDSMEHIRKALDYALKETPSFGGFVLSMTNESGEMTGAVVVNRTGMQGYIPDNILVYIATRKDQRGKGVGKKLMEKVMEQASGDIALHVEKDNPAKGLYEKFGFTNPYLEMRLKR